MSHPRRYLIRMIVFLAAVATVALVLAPGLQDAFMSNAALNGLILGVMVLGIGYISRAVLVLTREVSWLEHFRAGQPSISSIPEPKLLAPMASMLGERSEQFSLSAMSMRSLLDGVGARLDESRDISRYLIGLLIFLGLLGTFWGLLQTIDAVSDVIANLSVGTKELGPVFDDLKAGLQAPLSGMGTAFSSSLFGLGGSLVLGFLELQAGQAQNRFYNDLEDWLSGQTRLVSGTLSGEVDQSVPAYVQALLEQTADSLENLQRALRRGEESRIRANSGINELVERLGTLTDQMKAEQNLMVRLAESQMELAPVLTRIDETLSKSAQGGVIGDAMSTHLRNIDVNLARLLEDGTNGRTELVQEVRTEIRVLSRTLAAIAEKAGR
ncbi:MAG TPA: flagellar motor protein MotA [Rhodospirillaceae bacterium]|nr:flagellar motor protein MotA [Rhodospirillaceae bacterium]|tara:strand:+ start:604 stop:1752 length:1149 start_codon:yes stop_codon:yes gene_type:complete